MYDKQRVIDVALAEVGYREKASNASLDDKTANAGSANRTKYARDLDVMGFYNTGKQGVAWCDVFVDWCFVQAYGLAAALKLTCQSIGSAGAGCRYSRDYYKRKGQLYDDPQPGDQAFYWPKNRTDKAAVQHTALVVAVDDTYYYTVEGNTSSADGVVYNGGGVYRKKYKLGYARSAGFGRPDWTMDEVADMDVRATLRKGDTGELVKQLQELLNLDKRYGGLKVDGIFGSGTLSSVRAFQADHGLTPDGVVGAKTWPVLDALKGQEKPPETEWAEMTVEQKVENLNQRLKAVEGGESNG